MAADFDENTTKQMMVDIHHDPLDWIKKENIPEEPTSAGQKIQKIPGKKTPEIK